MPPQEQKLAARTYTIYLTIDGDDAQAMDDWVYSGRWLDLEGKQGTATTRRGDIKGTAGWESGDVFSYDEEGDEIEELRES